MRSEHFNPEMLVLARESRGLSQTELARDSGVRQDFISRYETGILSIKPEHLASLAAILRYPLPFFNQGETRQGLGGTCIHYRKKASLPVKVQRQIVARMDVVRLHVKRLLDIAHIESSLAIPHYDLDDFGGQPERVARELRRYWSMPSGPIANLTKLIEDSGGLVLLFHFGSAKIDGSSRNNPGLPPLFFINKDIPGDRARYTLAHELGHVLMHPHANGNPEPEADKFAAEFLMPERDIAQDLNFSALHQLEPLKAKWKVSMQALIRRARDIGRISPDQYTNFFIQLSRMGYRVHEPVDIALERPTLLKALFDAYFDQLDFNLDEVSQAMLALPAEAVETYAHELAQRFEPATSKIRIKPRPDLEIIHT